MTAEVLDARARSGQTRRSSCATSTRHEASRLVDRAEDGRLLRFRDPGTEPDVALEAGR